MKASCFTAPLRADGRALSSVHNARLVKWLTGKFMRTSVSRLSGPGISDCGLPVARVVLLPSGKAAEPVRKPKFTNDWTLVTRAKLREAERKLADFEKRIVQATAKLRQLQEKEGNRFGRAGGPVNIPAPL